MPALPAATIHVPALAPPLAEANAVLRFWYPPGLERADADTHLAMFRWWMGGGANAELAPLAPLVPRALAGELDTWPEVAGAAGRLALILVLDQFTRGVAPRGSAAAYAGDPRALDLAEAGIDNGDLGRLAWPWERLFLLMPLVHAEGPGHAGRAARAADMAALFAEEAPARLRNVYRGSAAKGREHAAVILRFGRFPHRNAALGREATAEEQAYVRDGQWPHLSPMQPAA